MILTMMFIGAFLGLLIGLPIMLLSTRACPHCRSDINRKASVCPKCGRDTGFLKNSETVPMQEKRTRSSSPQAVIFFFGAAGIALITFFVCSIFISKAKHSAMKLSEELLPYVTMKEWGGGTFHGETIIIDSNCVSTQAAILAGTLIERWNKSYNSIQLYIFNRSEWANFWHHGNLLDCSNEIDSLMCNSFLMNVTYDKNRELTLFSPKEKLWYKDGVWFRYTELPHNGIP